MSPLARAAGRRGKIARGLSVLLAIAVGFGVAVAVAGPAGRSLLQRPTPAQVAGVMWRTILMVEPMEHFYPAGQLTTTSDGAGGTLTAEVGILLPSTDGDGQLVFFWHNRHFVGWDSSIENMSVLQLESLGARGFRITYADYAPDDPACCPSLIPISVAYRWRHGRLVAQQPGPLVSPMPGRVRLIR
jgi:LppP/LprE lipoprotein